MSGTSKLLAIASSLDSYEWRELQIILGRRTFKYDIISNLPVELVLQILSYLDPVTPFRLQRVCKKWLHVLSSLQVLHASLSQWYSSSDPPLVGHSDLSAREEVAVKLAHMQGFRTGFPNSRTEIAITDEHTPETPQCGDLNGGWLAWALLSSNDVRVRVVNLLNNEAFLLCGQAREQPNDILLSQDLVLCVNETRTHYACDLLSKEQRSVTLPSALFISYDVSRKTVAYLMQKEPRRYDHQNVVVWDFQSQKMTSFEIRGRLHAVGGCLMVHESLLLSSNEPTLTLIMRGVCPKGVAYVGFEKYDYTGQLIATAEDLVYHCGEEGLEVLNRTLDKSHCSHDDRFRIVIGYASSWDHPERHKNFIYDDRSMLVQPMPDKGQSELFSQGAPLLQQQWWKNVAFETDELHGTLFHRSIIDGGLVSRSFEPGDLKELDVHYLHINDRFLVLFSRQLSRSVAHIFGFDPNVSLQDLRTDFTTTSLDMQPLPFARQSSQ